MLKIVYVLVGTDKPEYMNMLRISVASVKKHMPDIDVVILTDNDTFKGLNANDLIFAYKNITIKPVDIPKEYNTVEKSRYLKTNLRDLINGDFLYIDSDTIVCKDFSDISPDFSVGLVLDENRLLYEQDDHGESIKRRAHERGYNLDACERYYNGGVIFAKDDETAHLFFHRWFDEWNRTRKPGMYQDQFSLNYVNQELGIISELDGTWNCQPTASYQGIGFLKNVKILHYLSIQPAGIYQLNNIEFLKKELNADSIKKIIDYPEKAFREFHVYADDSTEYTLFQTSHYHLIERIYTKHKKIFSFVEKLLKAIRK